MEVSSGNILSSACAGDLNHANIVVGAGRGLGRIENFKRLVRLSEILNAQVGGTRGAVDAGWIPKEREIGLSGKRVCPALYLACGVSGSNFHTIGMEHSEYIVAINPDIKARIHELANISIYADVNSYIGKMYRALTTISFDAQQDNAISLLKEYFIKNTL